MLRYKHDHVSASQGKVTVTLDTEIPRPFTFPNPTPEALARRKLLGAIILKNRKHRVITPLTTADLVHMAREDDTWYGSSR
jgi:hypothetical protein